MTSSSQRSSWNRVDQGIRCLENFIATCLLAAIIVIVLLEVFFRYVLSDPLSWSSEVATYLFAWLTLMGVAIAQRDYAHVAVRLFAHLNETVAIATAWFAWIASFVFFGILSVGGYLFVAGETIQMGPASGIPLWIIYTCVPTGAILGLYHTLCDLPQLVRSPLALATGHHHHEEVVGA